MAVTGTTANIQITQQKPANTLAVYNAGTVDIGPNLLVIPDASNIFDNDDAQPVFSVTLPTSTSAVSRPIGLTMTTIKAGDSGTIASFGPVRVGTCYTTITCGAAVANTITSGSTGKLTTAVSGYPSVGIALATGAATDEIPFMLVFSENT